MKAITLHEPWASFIMWGWKTIETRTHRRYRKYLGETIAIHASKIFDDSGIYFSYMTPEQKMFFIRKQKEGHFKESSGKIICLADVIGFGKIFPGQSKAAMIYCDRWENIRYGLHLVNIRSLEKFVPAKGHQFPWNYEGGEL